MSGLLIYNAAAGTASKFPAQRLLAELPPGTRLHEFAKGDDPAAQEDMLGDLFAEPAAEQAAAPMEEAAPAADVVAEEPAADFMDEGAAEASSIAPAATKKNANVVNSERMILASMMENR